MPVIQSSYFLREIRPAFGSDLSLSMSRSIRCVLMATLAGDEVPEVCERVAILHGLSVPSPRLENVTHVFQGMICSSRVRLPGVPDGVCRATFPVLVGHPLTHIELRDLRRSFASNKPEASRDWGTVRKVFRDGRQPLVCNKRTPDDAVHGG